MSHLQIFAQKLAHVKIEKTAKLAIETLKMTNF